jgi:hypothetical protein
MDIAVMCGGVGRTQRYTHCQWHNTPPAWSAPQLPLAQQANDSRTVIHMPTIAHTTLSKLVRSCGHAHTRTTSACAPLPVCTGALACRRPVVLHAAPHGHDLWHWATPHAPGTPCLQHTTGIMLCNRQGGQDAHNLFMLSHMESVLRQCLAQHLLLLLPLPVAVVECAWGLCGWQWPRKLACQAVLVMTCW